MYNILKLLRTMFSQDRRISPDIFLYANAEILFGTILICLALTAAVRPEKLRDNPIRKMVGYNNPCVVWDDPPALYLAAFLFTPTVYFATRYAVLDSHRALLTPELSKGWKRFVVVVNTIYAVSQAINYLIFVITPGDGSLWSLKVHSLCFLQLVPCLGLCMTANYLEAWASGRQMRARHWGMVVLCAVTTLLEASLAGASVLLYKNDGVPLIPPWIMQLVDWGWFASLPFISFLVPDAPKLHVTIDLFKTVPVSSEESPSGDDDSSAPATSRS